MVQILVVDDHAIVRKGVIRILESTPDLEAACDEAANAAEAARLTAERSYDLVFLDISLPGTGGLDLLKILHRDYPRMPVIMLSMHPEDQYGIRALTLGAAGYLTKESAPEELVVAARRALGGGRYISSSLAERMAAHLGSGSAAGKGELRHEELSDREFEILRLIGAGRTPSQIAAQLFLSVKTVSTYRTRVLQKMELKSNAELMNYALKHKLTE